MPASRAQPRFWHTMLREVQENPRRAVHVVLWLLLGFLLPFGVVIAVSLARALAWVIERLA
jgi:hypothetical protein